MARGSLLRIDEWTEIKFLALPDPYAEFPDNSVLQVVEGRVRLTMSVARLPEQGRPRRRGAGYARRKNTP